MQTEHALWQIFRVKSGMAEREQAKETLAAQLDEAVSVEKEAENVLLEHKKSVAKSSRLLATAEKDQAVREKDCASIAPKVAALQEKAKNARKKLAELEVSEQRLTKDISSQERRMTELRADAEALEREEARLQAQLASAGTGIQLNAEMISEYTRIRGNVAGRTAAETARMSNLEREGAGKRHRLEAIAGQLASLNGELRTADTFILEYEERATLLRNAVSACKAELSAIDEERNSVSRLADESQDRIDKTIAEIDAVNNKLKEAGDDRVRSKRELALSEAATTMKQIFTGVHGKLSDLCRPIQKRFSMAVAVAAGKHMDAIVVDTKQVAADCIRYLKDQRIGTCVFLPLDNISSKPIPERLRGLGDSIRVAIDLVECEDAFKSAVAYALGDAIVCDTLEQAQRLAFRSHDRVKVVTLTGHVISKAGTMTGGTAGRDGLRDKWEDRDVDEWKQQKASLEDTLGKLRRMAPSRQTVLDLETRRRTVEARMQFSTADLSVCEEKNVQLRQQRELKTASKSSLSAELAATESALAGIVKSLNEAKIAIRAVEAEEFRDFSMRVGVENICEYEENVLKAHQDILSRRTAVAEQQAALRAQLEYELKRDFRTAKEKVEGQIRSLREELISIESKLSIVLSQDAEKKEEITRYAEQLNKLKKERTADLDNTKEQQKKLAAATLAKEGVSRRIAIEEIEVERMRTQLHELLQKTLVDEISLPTKNIDRVSSGSRRGSNATEVDMDLQWSGSSSQRRRSLGSRRSGASDEDAHRSSSNGSSRDESAHFSQPDNPIVTRDADEVSLVDLSSLYTGPNKSAISNKQHLNDLLGSLTRKMTELATELSTMQPNMHAAERYDGVESKLQECSDSLEEVREAAQQISVKFEEVKKIRYRLFMRCYKHVSDALSIIYTDLTKSSKHPVGGKAFLTLEKTDEPYLGGVRYNAMPPMKRYRQETTLSL
jgi:structural maintenance of chromosome 1